MNVFYLQPHSQSMLMKLLIKLILISMSSQITDLDLILTPETEVLLELFSVFAHRLFRESCVYDRGNYVKDLSKLGREITRTIIIDNSPASYLFQPQNAIPCSSWFDDKNDTLLKGTSFISSKIWEFQ